MTIRTRHFSFAKQFVVVPDSSYTETDVQTALSMVHDMSSMNLDD